MLQHLNIENIALIDKLSIEPTSHLNVLTGETGAGKSIIIDSINFVIGTRVSKEIIRTGQDKAVVEAVFDSDVKFVPFFEERGLPFDEESIILFREYNVSGRNICRINGRIVNTSLLAEVGELLVDMHGQYDNQSLMKSSLHIALLDLFCGPEFNLLLETYREKYAHLREFEKELTLVKSDILGNQNRIDLLKYQINEIEQASLLAGEDIELESKRLLMKNSEKICEALTYAFTKLSENSDGFSAANDQLADAHSKLLQVSTFSPEIAEISEKLGEQIFMLQDLSAEIRDLLSELEFSVEELEAAEERLDLLGGLKKKYGADIDEIFLYYENAIKELERIDVSPDKIREMEEIFAEMSTQTTDLAEKISTTRKAASKKIESLVAHELSDLEMRGASFIGNFSSVPLAPNGVDKMEFLFSANKGEPEKPLSKIASGGEMSRVMLAIKSILAEVDQIPLLIFDEIDSGISGVASQKVGEKLKGLARTHQVICVTHHAQIAAMADTHFFVSKVEAKADGASKVSDATKIKTLTIVKDISSEERVAEIGRLLSGTHTTEASLSHSRELLERGQS